MHKKAFLPAGCVLTLISSMCQESDSSRQRARGELGLCAAVAPGQEAVDSHSSVSGLIREMMGKHADAGGGKKVIAKCLENITVSAV